ncbi:site-specific DNA-methyltransferase [Vallitalea sediminicola]
MPSLDWIGKDKVINYHQEVPLKTLNLKYSYNDGDSTKKEKNFANKIIKGDNLEALKALLPQYETLIKRIYIDPPYNTGNKIWVYNDNVDHPRIKKWLGKVVGKEGEDLSRHDKWLCMMYPRLKLLHKLLSPDGIIYISIDNNEVSHLRLIMNEIFGENNFLAKLIWRGMHTVRNSSKDFNHNTEYILVYAKNKSKLIPTSKKEYYLRAPKDKTSDYPYDDNDGRGLYKLDPIYARNPYTPYEIIFDNGVKWKAKKGNYPRYSKVNLKKMYHENKLVFSGKEPKAKRYLKDVQIGVPPDTLLKPEDVGFNKDGTSILYRIFDNEKLFDQPKPPQLIEYLLNIDRQVDTDDYYVLDSFAGSGTTAHAVLNLNKQDGGNRKFILIEMEDYATNVTAERVKKVITGYGSDDKIVKGTGGSFEFYELGEPIFTPENTLNNNIDIDVIRHYIYYTETKQTINKDIITSNKYFLGSYNNCDYYFYYYKNKDSILNYDFLNTIDRKAEQYIIYANKCTLSKETLYNYKVIFKKIPRDITKI